MRKFFSGFVQAVSVCVLFVEDVTGAGLGSVWSSLSALSMLLLSTFHVGEGECFGLLGGGCLRFCVRVEVVTAEVSSSTRTLHSGVAVSGFQKKKANNA